MFKTKMDKIVSQFTNQELDLVTSKMKMDKIVSQFTKEELDMSTPKSKFNLDLGWLGLG